MSHTTDVDISRVVIDFIYHMKTCDKEHKAVLISKVGQCYHRFIDQLTYDQFLHFKKVIKSAEWYRNVRAQFYNKYLLDHFVSKSTVSLESFSSIKAAFINTCDILSLTFLHGTQIGTLILMLNGDKLLKPGGKRKKELCLHGEYNKGFEGVSKKKISGTSLEFAHDAFKYAMHNSGYHFADPIKAVIEPEIMTEQLALEIDELTDRLKDFFKLSDYRNNFVHHDAPSQRLFNLHRTYKIAWTLAPQAFEEKVLPKLHHLVSTLIEIQESAPGNETKDNAKVIREHIFEPILGFKDSLPNLTKNEVELIKEDLPLIFGSSTVKTVRFKTRRMRNLAYPIGFNRELAFKGSLELGKDLQVIFTARESIEVVTRLLHSKNIHHIPVLDMDAVILVSNFKQYREKVLRNP